MIIKKVIELRIRNRYRDMVDYHRYGIQIFCDNQVNQCNRYDIIINKYEL
jgi:hypothetical protein